MHAVAKEASAKQAAELGADGPKPGPVKRGARPDRPSQVNREAGRSWERMAERLSDLKAELATTTAALETTCAETVELKGKMAEMETEHGQRVKLLMEQISQLEAANLQVSAAHNQLLASLPELGHSGQYKQLFEQAEAARADLQKRLEKNTADHLRQMQVMLDEKQAAAEERRAQLVKEHVRQLQKKESEVKEQSREVTALREELLQKDETIKSLQTQAQREREKERERERKKETEGEFQELNLGGIPSQRLREEAGGEPAQGASHHYNDSIRFYYSSLPGGEGVTDNNSIAVNETERQIETEKAGEERQVVPAKGQPQQSKRKREAAMAKARLFPSRIIDCLTA